MAAAKNKGAPRSAVRARVLAHSGVANQNPHDRGGKPLCKNNYRTSMWESTCTVGAR